MQWTGSEKDKREKNGRDKNAKRLERRRFVDVPSHPIAHCRFSHTLKPSRSSPSNKSFYSAPSDLKRQRCATTPYNIGEQGGGERTL